MKAKKLRQAKKYQTLQVLQDGALEGVTRSHFCFPIFPDDEEVVYVCHRSCPKSPKQYLCQQQYPREVAKVSASEKRSERPQTNICWSNGSKKIGWLCDYSYCIFCWKNLNSYQSITLQTFPPSKHPPSFWVSENFAVRFISILRGPSNIPPPCFHEFVRQGDVSSVMDWWGAKVWPTILPVHLSGKRMCVSMAMFHLSCYDIWDEQYETEHTPKF